MDKYILETDGSHYLNQTGIGGILYKNGEILDIFSAKIEDNTEDYEAYGILYGLQLAKQHGIDSIEVRNDGLNSIKYYNHTDIEDLKNSRNKKEVYTTIKNYSKNFSKIKFVHYKRERNKIADYFSTIYKNFPILEFKKIDNSGIFKNLEVLNIKKTESNDTIKTNTLLISIMNHNNINILNIIKFNNKTNNYQIQRKELSPDLSMDKMATVIYDEIIGLNSTEEIKLIINGKIAENIHFAIHGYKGFGKSIKTSFRELQPHWNEIKDLNLLQSYDKQKLKTVLKKVYLKNDPSTKINFIEKIKINISTFFKKTLPIVITKLNLSIWQKDKKDDERKTYREKTIFKNLQTPQFKNKKRRKSNKSSNKGTPSLKVSNFDSLEIYTIRQ